MSYEQIVNLIFTVITAIVALPAIHFTLYAIVGIFAYKKFPEAQTKRKIGIVIAARNEGKVIFNLVDSIRKNDYPQNLLTVFVVAHNCTDDTAEQACEAGAVVYEYNNDSERMKGYALKHLFECIENDYGISSFDGYMFFDADNVLSENYISKMNDAFEFYNGEGIITSFRNSKNFSQNLLSSLYGILFTTANVIEHRGRTLLNCSARVSGTGFLVNSEVMKDGWNYVTITEDLEFTADQILRGTKVRYCEEAVFYDEQPTQNRVMLRQRLRWAKGSLVIVRTRGFKLLSGVFKRKTKTRGSTYDIWAYVQPYALISLILGVLQMILLSPLFGVPLWGGVTFEEYCAKNWMTFVSTFLSAYMLPVVQSIAVLISARKKIPHMSFGKKLLAVLCYPFFVYIGILLSLVALFVKVEWKQIPHKESISSEMLSGAVAATAAKQTKSKKQKNKTEKK